jgi:hypothetical protein
MQLLYSSPPLIRPVLLQQKCGLWLIRGVVSLEGDNLLVQMYFTISVHLKYGLIRGVAFSGSGLIRGVAFSGSGLIRGVAFSGSGLIRGVVFSGSGLIRGVAFSGSGLIRGGAILLKKTSASAK